MNFKCERNLKKYILKEKMHECFNLMLLKRDNFYFKKYVLDIKICFDAEFQF